MEIDIVNISDVLREVIAFLECLHEVQLPLTLESLREKLLTRSKDTLSIATMPRTSPEPYLDMNSGPKSLLLKKSEADSEEYVGMEGSKKQNNHHQDYYYETFENEGRQGVANERRPEQNDDETEEGQALIRIYKNLSAAQIKSKCHKCGPLFKKEGRKLFLSESRACWIALVGSHLLIYRTERHNRPYAIYPIRGYMARPAPNLIPRDRQKSESAFEMYRPGNETLRFIARTPKDMEQWITKICEVGCGGNHTRSAKGKAEGRGRKRRTIVVSESPTSRDEIRYRDDARESTLDALDSPTVKGESASDKDEEAQEAKGDPGANPPPLPARIPRRLPSLPPDDAIPSYRAAVEDDDDDDEIYHKIEDLKNGTRYQNMVLSRKQRAEKKRETVVAYDDVRAPEEGNNEGQTREERSCDAIPSEEMYDDVIAVTRSNAAANSERQNHDRPVANGEEEREKSYDDVENLLSGSGKFTKDRAKDQTEISSKSPQKKSFLGRVLSRKESPGKSGKRYKGKASSSPPPSSTKEETSIYDDASDMTANYRESLADEGEELPEYNCPPPPRPVYTNSTTLNGQVDQIEALYDDVSACREQYKNQMQTSLQSTQESGMKTRETPGNANTELEANDDDPPREEIIEHYQSPRSDLCVRDIAENQQQDDEKLYDDVDLLRDFTARQRDIAGKRDANEDATRSTISPDKRSWNRFAAINRKSRASDSAEDLDDSCEGNGACSKRNTFQKLISRVENSLAKVSSRGNPSSLPTGKSSMASNNS
ncbi:unnamed protein product [Lasius platythorax]|uniref:PH domain-containing protein n=1 Tax=Lasius platythorax TaxID=488582 RepID=A0AAV2NIT1_9HYME